MDSATNNAIPQVLRKGDRPACVAMRLLLLAAVYLLTGAVHAANLTDAQAARILELTLFDRLALCNAQSEMQQQGSKPALQLQRGITYTLYELRPAGVWDESHPAWIPAKKALLEIMVPDTSAWLNNYWKESSQKIVLSDLRYAFTVPEAEALLDFAATPGAHAWFARRLAECKAKNAGGVASVFRFEGDNYADPKGQLQEANRRFDALPADEKRRVADFTGGAKCAACARPPFAVLTAELAEKARWLGDVLSSHFDMGSADYEIRQRWVAQLETRIGATLPVVSKKQFLGQLAMQNDRTLEFRIQYFADNKPNGGSLALRFPPAHPNYAEVLKLAPTLAAGSSHPLYRDKDGIVSDQP